MERDGEDKRLKFQVIGEYSLILSPSFYLCILYTVYTLALTHTLFCLLTAELKMEILRERELRENVEKQMMEDQRMRGKRFLFFFFCFCNRYWSEKDSTVTRLYCHERLGRYGGSAHISFLPLPPRYSHASYINDSI